MSQRKNGDGVESDSGVDSDANVDKIRDILFGGQMRDYDRRFDHLEKEYQRRLDALDAGFGKKLGHLDSLVKREIEKAQKRSVQEKKERTDALQELRDNLAALAGRLDQHLTELEERFGEENTEIRRDIERNREELLDDTKQLLDTLTNFVRAENDELQNTKADRIELASLFTEFAMRLNREFELPEA